MGWFSKKSAQGTAVSADAPTFAVTAEDIPSTIFGLEAYAENVTVAPRIDRRRAMSVPAVKRARDMICGSLGGLPLHLLDTSGQRIASPLFEQPEPDVARSVTMVRTFEDVLFEGRAWWRVLARDYRGWPTSVRRLDPRSVDVRRDMRVYVRPNGSAQGSAWEWVADADLIRIESPHDALLVAGARAIRTCLLIDAAANRFAEGIPPLDFFTPADGVDVDEEDADAALAKWETARRNRSTGFVGSALKYNVAGWNPEQLQMADARREAVLEIARLTGLDPEDLGVSTTSRTYQNGESRRQDRIDTTLGPYARAVEDTFAMGNVTPRGQLARFDFDSYLRPDPKTRYEAYAAGLEIGATTPERIAQAEGLRVEDVQPAPTLRALPAPSEESA